MEFEQDSTITDEQRILAATKSVRIEPINATIVREDFEVPTIVEQHANVERDSEDTAQAHNMLQPSKSVVTAQPRIHRHATATLTILACLIAGIVGGATLFVMFG